ncbi:hypothetical protein DSM106972_063210 [Dulcicalothrix desertica PCC 7102]|uniref:Leucine rich repeat variant n=1 Tax=Dulcicalothrix desertica PCC 7102 TaxID=232991 RepID=A0A433V7Z6_9CYAN|nr:hypothetical protein [Dulcicalothrix desertica]RUT02246.1 hypothetical protein DSM106972_063210 [Dulcicalothrix desertica PCC 7102]TWH53888.1 hypothetical protein CAL7102_01881 [Dulcicalothrix desertica PCC 7102]
MINHSNQPQEFDAVIGGNASPTLNDVVLGGIQGVKKRLESEDEEQQVAALEDALKYGDAGIDLIIETLYDSFDEMHNRAARLLRKAGIKGKQVLLDYDPWLWFTTFKDWEPEDLYDSDIEEAAGGIVYIVGGKRQLLTLLNNSKVGYIEAIKIQKYVRKSYTNKSVQDVVDLLVEKKNPLKNLQALFVGEFCQTYNVKYKTSKLDVCSIYPLLKAYPFLELLHIRGRMVEEDILKNNSQLLQIRSANGNSFTPSKALVHNHLKTLIVEAAEITEKNLTKICNLDLPSLEYFELWLGRGKHYNINLDILAPILSGKSFPNLLFLAIRGTANTSEIAQAITKSPILNKLRVLELTDGNLTNIGAIALLKTPSVNRLHTLDVSGNRINPGMLEQLSQLKCRVLTGSQFNDRYYSIWE